MPKKSDGYDKDGLLSWVVIAKILGLTKDQVQRSYMRALKKLKPALLKEGITEDEFRAYLALRKESRDE